MNRLLTYQDVARLTGQSESTIKSLRYRGELKAVVLGPRRIRFKPEEVQRWIQSKEEV